MILKFTKAIDEVMDETEKIRSGTREIWMELAFMRGLDAALDIIRRNMKPSDERYKIVHEIGQLILSDRCKVLAQQSPFIKGGLDAAK